MPKAGGGEGADQHRKVKWLARTRVVRLGRGSGTVSGSQVLSEFRVSTFLGSMTQVFEFSGNPGVRPTLEEKLL